MALSISSAARRRTPGTGVLVMPSARCAHFTPLILSSAPISSSVAPWKTGVFASKPSSSADPAERGLQDLPDVHAARHAERVEHDLHRRAVGQERHVLLGHDPGDDALVAVAARHLVADADLALLGDVDLHQLHHAGRQLVGLEDLVDLLLGPLAHALDPRLRLVMRRRIRSFASRFCTLSVVRSTSPSSSSPSERAASASCPPRGAARRCRASA
jgi:hypothetical protein